MDRLQSFKGLVTSLPASDQLKLLSDLFCEYTSTFYELMVDEGFLQLSLMAMKYLESHSKENVLYHLAKGLGTPCPHSNEPRLPVSKMPFGLLEYTVTFFSSTSRNLVRNNYNDPPLNIANFAKYNYEVA